MPNQLSHLGAPKYTYVLQTTKQNKRNGFLSPPVEPSDETAALVALLHPPERC